MVFKKLSLVLLLLTACGRIGGNVTGTGTDTGSPPSPTPFSQSYDFSSSSNFTYNSAVSQISSGSFQLSTVVQTDADGTSEGFGGGAHHGTEWDPTNLGLTAITNTWALPNNATSTGWASTSGNILLYHLDEPSGATSFADGSGQSHTGTCTICPTAGLPGKFGNALQFNGLTIEGDGRHGQYVAIPSGFSSFPSGLTFELWVNPSSTIGTNNGARFIELGNGTQANPLQDAISFTMGQTTGLIDFVVYQGNTAGTLVESSAYALAINNWQHLVATLDSSGNVLIYKNGIQVASGTTSIPNTVVRTQNYLGRTTGEDWTNDTAFGGLMDEVAIYSRVLTPTEILAHYTQQLPQYSAYFDSRVFDAGTAAPWNVLSWTVNEPSWKALPGDNSSELAATYPALSSSTLMSDNAVLLHLDEPGSPTAFADSHTATVPQENPGACSGVGCPTPSPGLFGGAMTFNGTSNTITIPMNSGTPTSAFTLSAWVKPSSVNCGVLILSDNSGPGSSDYEALGFDTTGSAKAMIYDGSTKTVVGPQIPELAGMTGTIPSSWQAYSWSHLAATATSNGVLQVYMNGVPAGTPTPIGSLFAGGNKYYIGSSNTSGVGSNYYSGAIDEVVVWNRALSSNEILDLYRRGGTQVKFQARSCTDALCATSNLEGPLGTTTDYFSELLNLSLFQPSISFPGILTSRRYFQYEASIASYSSFVPLIQSVSVGPGGRYYAGSPSALNRVGTPFSTLTAFSATSSGTGTVTFQISNNGTAWYYLNGTTWTLASSPAQSSLASVVNANISHFSTDVGTGTFYFQAFLNSSGVENPVLTQVAIQGTQ